MGLSCSSDEWDGEGIGHEQPEDYKIFNGKRRKRCCSCGELINIGDLGAKFRRFRSPETDIEIQIHGEGNEIRLADHWLCETCADLFFNLDALGFCPGPEDDMRELVREYAHYYHYYS